ncbi:hypothetical protein [Rhizosaccharibacter radicis]|uniref:Cold-shock protein n=1 Tax=Rhizosaccharibacter radicis TaxID=2782605 RepID=A0ABT1VTS5_9PROT|nr:hypothetical protein [Acetobacteraceae bacterium KSS12]
MRKARFAVGEQVVFTPAGIDNQKAQGDYIVLRVMPMQHNSFDYRVRSERDNHERMVAEDRLDSRRIAAA